MAPARNPKQCFLKNPGCGIPAMATEGGGGGKLWREADEGGCGGRLCREVVEGSSGRRLWRRLWREAVEGSCGGKLWREAVEGSCGDRLWRQAVKGSRAGRLEGCCWLGRDGWAGLAAPDRFLLEKLKVVCRSSCKASIIPGVFDGSRHQVP